MWGTWVLTLFQTSARKSCPFLHRLHRLHRPYLPRLGSSQPAFTHTTSGAISQSCLLDAQSCSSSLPAVVFTRTSYHDCCLSASGNARHAQPTGMRPLAMEGGLVEPRWPTSIACYHVAVDAEGCFVPYQSRPNTHTERERLAMHGWWRYRSNGCRSTLLCTYIHSLTRCCGRRHLVLALPTLARNYPHIWTIRNATLLSRVQDPPHELPFLRG